MGIYDTDRYWIWHTDRQVEALSNAAIDSTGEAVTMAITMLGIMSMWTGLIEIAKRSSMLDQITRKLDPVLHFLFPRIPKDHIAKEYISANIVANLLGLGWAATPMGLKAMKELAKIGGSVFLIPADRSARLPMKCALFDH